MNDVEVNMLNLDRPITIITHDFPIVANMIYDDIDRGNVEDILWQNLIDTKSDLVQNEIGVSVTQSYQYSKLHNDTIIITKWQGVKTENGHEFRVGLGCGEPGSKIVNTILAGNFKTGLLSYTPITLGSSNEDQPYRYGTIGMHKGKLAVYLDNGWREIILGDTIE